MPETMIARLRPLWDEALSAFVSDPSYAIEMARAGAVHWAALRATR